MSTPAISSFLLFNNFFGSGKSKMWIFSSRHRLHLLLKDFGVLDLFKWTIVCQGLTLHFLIPNNVLIEQFDFFYAHGRRKIYDFHI